MIHDATVEVTCDGENCWDSITIELPFKHADYSGNRGRYDHRARAVNPLIEGEGWTVRPGEDDDRHYCEDCARSAK